MSNSFHRNMFVCFLVFFPTMLNIFARFLITSTGSIINIPSAILTHLNEYIREYHILR